MSAIPQISFRSGVNSGCHLEVVEMDLVPYLSLLAFTGVVIRRHGVMTLLRIFTLQIKRDKVTRLVVLPLYPQFSISTSASSLRLFEQMLNEDVELQVRFCCSRLSTCSTPDCNSQWTFNIPAKREGGGGGEGLNDLQLLTGGIYIIQSMIQAALQVFKTAEHSYTRTNSRIVQLLELISALSFFEWKTLDIICRVFQDDMVADRRSRANRNVDFSCITGTEACGCGLLVLEGGLPESHGRPHRKRAVQICRQGQSRDLLQRTWCAQVVCGRVWRSVQGGDRTVCKPNHGPLARPGHTESPHPGISEQSWPSKSPYAATGFFLGESMSSCFYRLAL